MLTALKTNCRALLSRVRRRLHRQHEKSAPIHVYYSKREDDDERLHQEVAFAMACGIEYAQNICCELKWRAEPLPDLRGLSVLEIGPGINLGAIFVCAILGARVAVFDKYLVEWRDEYHPRFYRLLRDKLHNEASGYDLSILDKIILEGCHSPEIVRATSGHIERGLFQFEDSTFDAIVSNAALEHVEDVSKLCTELRRITRPGGTGIHQVDFRDHSNNERPLDFLAIPDALYESVFAASQGGGGNRMRPRELIAQFERAGFKLTRFEPNCLADESYVREGRPGFLPRYASMSVEDLRVVGARLFVRA
jgi:SAM-dependent methyltransferase